MKSKRTWEVYVIHHSHTDIGYTERQEKLMRYHYDFICQAIDILDSIHQQEQKKYEGFIWQCENYWQVENFYKMADDTQKAKFEIYVKSGEIGISGNYLNMTELVTAPVLDYELQKMEDYGKRIGHPVTAAMCADINGMAWGYSEQLYSHGVRSFFSCLHPHHGMFPLYKKAMPFYWETPSGNRLLVWNGDHYHLGNEMFLAPCAGTTYTIFDEYSAVIANHQILKDNAQSTHDKELEIAKVRIGRYLDQLEEEKYPYTIVPFMVSGAITDNAPPSKEVASRIRELNEIFDGQAVFKMVGLEQFFEIVRSQCTDIPVYSGDWTDWWADGIGSTPAEVKLYKDAARKYNICKKLDPKEELGSKYFTEKAADELMLYAEHTWGYSSSVSEPWESLVNVLALKKSAYAVNAHTHISKNLDMILAHKGEVSISGSRGNYYKVINPHAFKVTTRAYLYIEFWEYMNGVRYDVSMPIEVTDCKSGTRIPCQVKQIARAVQVEIEITLAAGEERIVCAAPVKCEGGTIQNYPHIGAEGVEDIIVPKVFRCDEDMIETNQLCVYMNDTEGIYSIVNKKTGQDILRKDRTEGAFAGVYEVTDIRGNACDTRRQMGRNRKAYDSRRYKARLIRRRIVEKGEVYIAAALDYALEGTKMYTVFIKVYQHLPKIEAMIRIHKESLWEPENLYVSLPFSAGMEGTFYIDKTGSIIRPGIDQLPGSCKDFYLIQNSMVWQSNRSSTALIAHDAPLIAMGDLKAHPITLCSGHDEAHNKDHVYSWIMNNFWETNFKVDLGGFYEFAYTLILTDVQSIGNIFEHCMAESEGIPAINIKKQ